MADQPAGSGPTGPSGGPATDSAGVSRSDLWSEVGIDPIEIALPRGTGYTLRAYRPERDVTPTEVVPDEADEPRAPATGTGRVRSGTDDDEPSAVDGDPDDLDDVEPADGDEADAESDEDAESDVEVEEVPLFLGARGRLYLFRTAAGLVEYVRSGATNDLSQLDSWSELVERIRPDDVAPDPDDVYELDLVVENLRGGHDVWDGPLLIKAGEIARDIGYAYGHRTVSAALAPGSPLDQLDEALRGAESGGVGGFLARRRVRRIGEQQAALGWRTVIGKISGLVDWRE